MINSHIIADTYAKVYVQTFFVVLNIRAEMRIDIVFRDCDGFGYYFVFNIHMYEKLCRSWKKSLYKTRRTSTIPHQSVETDCSFVAFAIFTLKTTTLIYCLYAVILLSNVYTNLCCILFWFYLLDFQNGMLSFSAEFKKDQLYKRSFKKKDGKKLKWAEKINISRGYPTSAMLQWRQNLPIATSRRTLAEEFGITSRYN